jgi:hypothetical protein
VKQIEFGIKEDDIGDVSALVYTSILRSMYEICKCASDNHLQYANRENQQAARKLIADVEHDSTFYLQSTEYYTHDVHTKLYSVWKDPVSQTVIQNSKYNVNYRPSIFYFYENFERIDPDVVVDSEKKIANYIHASFRSCGSVEYKLKKGENMYRYLDMGGAHSERRKYQNMLNSFGTVDCFVFFVPLGGYDVNMEEYPDVNRIRDSINLFEKSLESPNLKGVQVIVFYTQTDLMKNRIDSNPIANNITEYTDRNSVEEFIHYMDNILQNIYLQSSCYNNEHKKFVSISGNVTNQQDSYKAWQHILRLA